MVQDVKFGRSVDHLGESWGLGTEGKGSLDLMLPHPCSRIAELPFKKSLGMPTSAEDGNQNS